MKPVLNDFHSWMFVNIIKLLLIQMKCSQSIRDERLISGGPTQLILKTKDLNENNCRQTTAKYPTKYCSKLDTKCAMNSIGLSNSYIFSAIFDISSI